MLTGPPIAPGRHQFAFIKATEGGDTCDKRILRELVAAKKPASARRYYHRVLVPPEPMEAAWFKRT